MTQAELADSSREGARALPASALYRRADLSGTQFSSTADIAPLQGLVGQKRAIDAIELGTQLASDGFNFFVTGAIDAVLREAVLSMLKQAASQRPAPSDWAYVDNFAAAYKPIAIELPTGRAPQFRDAMHDLISDLKIAMPAAFEREEYQTRRAAVEEEVRKKQVEAFSALGDRAGARGLAILRTPMGFAIAPARNGQIVPPDQFNTWPEEQRKKVQAEIRELEQELEKIVRQMPGWEKELRDRRRELNRDTAKQAIAHSIDEAKTHLASLPNTVAHLERVRDNLIENFASFILKADGESPEDGSAESLFERYEVNVIVTHGAEDTGAPVVEETHPTLVNLIGRAEYAARQGMLLTNFKLIKPGALHRANGGYLILDARSLLSEPFSWAALKRALRAKQITTEDVGHFMGITGTISLEPDPIPLDVKVVLVGERVLYYLLAQFDPEFREHFKILADFDDDIDRTADTESTFAQFVAGLVARKNLKAVDRQGVERLVEHAARTADSAEKLSLVAEDIADVLSEADFWCSKAGHDVILCDDVQKALDERERRAARVRERAQESILRGFALIDTQGTAVGQVNGLSVLELGAFQFGRPTRITARVRPGTGRVLDIEREVALGGPIHSKGVLILSGFLSGRYALDVPISLSASLVFEQSYGGVEGDSASSAELYALLSALGDIPLRQDLAVTGSVNQHGAVQAIGGVNEKIEGFFEICKARGLTGSQGVIIPSSNLRNLMLRADVVEACEKRTFAVYAVSTIDEGLALLTGLSAGLREPNGKFTEGSVNARIEDRLRMFADIRRSFAVSAPEKKT